MPRCEHVLTVVSMHGWIRAHCMLRSLSQVKLDDLRAIDRFHEPPDAGLMSEMLWSDPQKMNGRGPSKRGVGVAFGPDVAARFLDDN
eukprot:COSAG06_NODE_9789_length_1816_cov_21.224811_3_plen_86_part_01